MKKITLMVVTACLMSPFSALKADVAKKTIPNADVIKGQWHIIKGEIKSKWGELTHDEITQTEGDLEKLSGKLQKKYGWNKARADKEIKAFMKHHQSCHVSSNAEIIKGKWHSVKGKLKAQWGKLTHNDITRMEGNFEELSGKLQEKYGWEKARADKEINAFIARNKWS